MSGVPGGQAHGKGQVRNRIDEGDDIAAHPVTDALDGVAGQHLQGTGRDPLGFPGLDESLPGLAAPAAVDAAGCGAPLVGARAMTRPIVKTLGSAMPCWAHTKGQTAHQGASRTWSLSLPRLG